MAGCAGRLFANKGIMGWEYRLEAVAVVVAGGAVGAYIVGGI